MEALGWRARDASEKPRNRMTVYDVKVETTPRGVRLRLPDPGARGPPRVCAGTRHTLDTHTVTVS